MLEQWELALKALGQTTRLKIWLLLASGEHCVCELEQIVQLSQPAISQHVRLLKQAGLVNERRDGTWTYYSLKPAAFQQLTDELSRALGAPQDNVPEMAVEWAKQRAVLSERTMNCHTGSQKGCKS